MKTASPNFEPIESTVDYGALPLKGGNESTLPLDPDGSRATVAALLLCFITAILLCWRVNFSNASVQMAALFDSGKYLSSCQQVLNASGFIHHFTYGEWVTICKALKEPLMVDGPVLPLLGAAWYTLLNKTPDVLDMRAILVLQAILHATSASCLFLAAKRWLGNYKWAIIAAMAWAAYPPAVFGAGRFLTETITALLIIVIACLLPITLSQKYIRSIGIGFCVAAVFLLKAALAPGLLLSAAVVLLCLWRANSKAKSVALKQIALHLLSLCIGASIILLPWSIFSQQATGRVCLTAQREPVLNILIGANFETDGWSRNPETGIINMFDTKANDQLGVFLGLWNTKHDQLFNIAMRRVARLWSTPWNDTFNKWFGVPLESQMLWHQLICLLGSFGALCVLFAAKRKNNDTASLPTCTDPLSALILCTIVSHFIYVVFNATPRPAFTSMPFIFLLATSGLYAFSRKARRSDAGLIVIAVAAGLAALNIDLSSALELIHGNHAAFLASWLLYAVAATTFAFVVARITENKNMLVTIVGVQLVPSALICVAFATTPHSVPEWQCDLKPGSTINRSTAIPAAQTPDWAVLIVDGNYAACKATIEVNGTTLNEELAPLYVLTSKQDPMFNYQIFSGVINRLPDQLRQWRAVEIPLNLLKRGEENEITITGNDSCAGATVYGSYCRQEDGRLVVPSLWGFSSSKFLSETQPKLDPRYPEPLTASAAQAKCWLENQTGQSADLSPALGSQTGQYHAFICLGYDKGRKQIKLSSAETTINLLTAPVEVSKQHPFKTSYAVPKDQCTSPYLRIGIKGHIQTNNKINLLSKMIVRNLSNPGSDLFVPGSVQCIQRPEIEFAGDISTASLKADQEFFEVTLQSDNPIRLDSLQLHLTPRQRPDFAKATVAVY